MKAIIFDSSTIINFVMNGLENEFRALKKIFNGNFLVTKEVYDEIIVKPLKIKRFKLEALKIKSLFSEKIIEPPSVLGINENLISKETKKVLDIANNTFFARGKAMNIIHSGEASCIALGKILNEKGIQNVLSIDERTTRMIIEKPQNLSKLFKKKLHTQVNAKTENFSFFKNFKVIRSTELIYIAYKKGMIALKSPEVLDALLYALKMNGCSITDEEISEIKAIA